MTAREEQVAELLATRERQVERFEAIEQLRHHRLHTGQVTNELRTHHGYGLSVKTHRISCSCESEVYMRGGCDCGYELARDTFWNDAEHIAIEHGFEGVYQYGRSGGWCVVEPQPHTDDMYESEVEEYERFRLGPFVLDVKQLLRDYEQAWARGELIDGSRTRSLDGLSADDRSPLSASRRRRTEILG